MRFTIILNQASPRFEAPDTAYQFTHSLIQTGRHNASCIFLHEDGVYLANQHVSPPEDELNLTMAWNQLAEEHDFWIEVCSASAMRRGITDDLLPSRYRISGLAQLYAKMAESDRVVRFGSGS